MPLFTKELPYPTTADLYARPVSSMSIHDFYIGCALQGILANPRTSDSPDNIAYAAIAMVDAIIKNLETRHAT